jgi:DNA mismatch repair ATPase MutS
MKKETLYKDYTRLKSKYPKHLIWYTFSKSVQAMGDCAIITSSLLDTRLMNKKHSVTGFPISDMDTNLSKAITAGLPVAVVSYYSSSI